MYIVLAIVVVTIIGLIIYKLSNKDKTNDNDIIAEEEINKINFLLDKENSEIMNLINNIDTSSLSPEDNLKNAIELARKLGVSEEQIIKNKDELDAFMMN